MYYVLITYGAILKENIAHVAQLLLDSAFWSQCALKCFEW